MAAAAPLEAHLARPRWPSAALNGAGRQIANAGFLPHFLKGAKNPMYFKMLLIKLLFSGIFGHKSV